MRHYTSHDSLPAGEESAALSAGAYFGSIDASALAPQPAAPAQQPVSGPRVLQMALTATKAMAKFVGSGFRTVTGDAYRARLAACATCEHHTGLRCRVCGCVTAAKARLAHEGCPTGRWPS